MKILIDNGHGINCSGKRSPDGRLLEWKYTREIAREVVGTLKAQGFDAEMLVAEDSDISLRERCNRANARCDILGARNVCLVSIHNNAAGCGQWMNARGWEAWTSEGLTRSDELAENLYEAARKWLPEDTGLRMDLSDGDRDKEKNFTILHRSKCPACLTENLFMDNRKDLEYLLSAEGRKAIVSLHVEGIKSFILNSR